MAFIFQAEKKDLVGSSKNLNPGPGQYTRHQSYEIKRGYAPFLSTVEKDNTKKQKQTMPGPGAYDPALTIGNSLKPNKPFHSTIGPNKEETESTNFSNVFKSKTKRFEYKIDTELPGPGAYSNASSFGKAASTNALNSRTSVGFPIKMLTRDNKTVVPSIPSYTHSYGYSETDSHKLMLNKNPLIEIQQFVGPGYYDAKDPFQADGHKGTTWHKSTSKRFEAKETKLPTRNVGPGSYEVLKLDGAQPQYKSKASSGFASTTIRSVFGKDKSKNNVKFQHDPAGQPMDDFDPNSAHIMIQGKDEDVRFNDDHVPGPGAYHSEALASSLKVSYKPTKLQFFGSGTERFKNEPTASNELGPGEYSLPDDLMKRSQDVAVVSRPFEDKTKPKVPFQSQDQRFKDIKPTNLGPGVYAETDTIVERVNDRAKKGYLGSFGSTELRFKPPKIIEDTPEQARLKREAEARKTAPVEAEKKPTSFFVSKTNRKITNPQAMENPPPGSYDVNYYDLSKKVIQNESPYYTAKKAPFSSTETRFDWAKEQQRRKENIEEEPIDEHMVQKRNAMLKPDVKAKPSSVFSSKTTRATSGLTKNGLPGPGAYINGMSQDGWLKKTFNIKFIEEH